ncbi:MAG: sulfite exporter TauE/SafE family protein [Micromonosporaceae bacterium]|nr:sulfite exporter TauE/SafE family protein [Micromonosporaceae bacterium]
MVRGPRQRHPRRLPNPGALALPAMDLVHTALLLTAGLAAGTVNGIAGGGSLIVFPALMAAGLPPVAANVTNSIGVFPSLAAASVATRGDLHELACRFGQRRLLTLLPTIIAGTVVGCVLLLATPAEAFDRIVPFLVLGAGLVLAFRERLQRLVGHPAHLSPLRALLTVHGIVALITIYGGYFGAAMGILMVSGLALVLDETIIRISALKNIVAATCGFITVLIFGVFGPVHWVDAAIVASTTVIGGYGGARVARRMPAGALRALIVTFAMTVGGFLLWKAFS